MVAEDRELRHIWEVFVDKLGDLQLRQGLVSLCLMPYIVTSVVTRPHDHVDFPFKLRVSEKSIDSSKREIAFRE